MRTWATAILMSLLGCGPSEVHVSELCEDPEDFLGDSLSVTFAHPIPSTVAVATTIALCDPPCCANGWYVAAVPCGGDLLAVVPEDVRSFTVAREGESPFVCLGTQPDTAACYPDCGRYFDSWTVLEGTLDRERADGMDFVGPVQPDWVLNVTGIVR